MPVLAPGLLLAAFAATAIPDPDGPILTALGISSSDAGLIAYLRSHVPASVPSDEVERLVGQLAAPMHATRATAQEALVRGGPAVAARLREMLPSNDPEVRQQVARVIARVDAAWAPKNAASFRAAVRVLARRGSTEAVESLMAAVPLLAEDELLNDVWAAVDRVARQAGRVPDCCVAVDPNPDRRALTAYLLGRRGSAEQQERARVLLKDQHPLVRLRAAQGLLGAGSLDAVPVLTALLDHTPLPVAWQAEELLRWLAGAGTPETLVGDGNQGAAARAAWDKWWAIADHSVVLAGARASSRKPLLLFVRGRVRPDGRSAPSRLIGGDGGVRWLAALPGRRVMCEQMASSGATLGLAWPVPDGRPPGTWPRFPTLVQFTVPDSHQVEVALEIDGTDEVVAKRWAGGWIMVAGKDRFGFIPPGNKQTTRWSSVAALTRRAEESSRPQRDSLIREQHGTLTYVCRDYQASASQVVIVEPATGKVLSAKPNDEDLRLSSWSAGLPGIPRLEIDDLHARLNEFDDRGQRIRSVAIPSIGSPTVTTVFAIVRLGVNDNVGRPE